MSSPAPITSTRARFSGSVGETNTASNQNAGGVGVFIQKTGVDLEFRGVNAGSSKITVTDDAGNNEIDIDVDESAFDIANLGGTLAHSVLSGIGANDHHAQSHVLATTAGLGPDHTTSGLTAGQVLRATSATTAAFQSLMVGDIPQLDHGGLSGLTDDDHTDYVHISTDRTISANHTLTSFTDVDEIAVPANPSSGTRRLFVDDATGEISVRTSAGATVSLESGGGASDHGALTGLTDDDHTQYLLLAGRAGGQVATGGTASDEDLELLPHDQTAALTNTGRIRVNERLVLWEDIPDLATAGDDIGLIGFDEAVSIEDGDINNVTQLAMLDWNPTITSTGATALTFQRILPVSLRGTVTLGEDTNILIVEAAGVRAETVYEFTGTSTNVISGALFSDRNQLTTALTTSTNSYTSYLANTLFEATDTGTLGVDSLAGFRSVPRFDSADADSDITLTSLVHFQGGLSGFAGDGDLDITTQIGLNLADLSTGTNTSISIQSETEEATMRHAGYALFGEEAAPDAVVHAHGQSIGSTDPTLLLECTDATSTPAPNLAISHESVETTDNTLTPIWTLATATSRVYAVYAFVVARRTDATAGNSRTLRVAHYENTGGTLTERSDANISSATGGTISSTVNFSPSGTTIQLNVKGANSQTIKWHATVFVQEIGS